MKGDRHLKKKPLRLIHRFGLAILGAGFVALGKFSLDSVPVHYTTSHRYELYPAYAILIGLLLIFVACNP